MTVFRSPDRYISFTTILDSYTTAEPLSHRPMFAHIAQVLTCVHQPKGIPRTEHRTTPRGRSNNDVGAIRQCNAIYLSGDRTEKTTVRDSRMVVMTQAFNVQQEGLRM